MQRKSDRLTEEQRKKVTDQIAYYFESEHDLKMGVIAAGAVLDFFQEAAGTYIYNKGIEDAKKAIKSRIDELRYDLDDLQEIP